MKVGVAGGGGVGWGKGEGGEGVKVCAWCVCVCVRNVCHVVKTKCHGRDVAACLSTCKVPVCLPE